ncbi:MAG: glycoside hydrolase family 28 protein [Bacteroidales bacterium]|nr:glycoside hydrolase family 28 protein [Bacteroidales bacterium]
MKISRLILALCLLAALPARGGDYARYYQNLPLQLHVPEAPVIPSNSVLLSDFGGVADGVTLNTEAFRKAVSALEKKGGGHLIVPAGIWLTGPIVLKDRIDLHLERNAMILMSPDKRQFIRPDGKAAPGITASKRKDVSITGEGVIDGNGEWWRAVKRGKVSDVEWKDYHRMGGTDAEEGSLWYPFDLKNYPNVADDYKRQEKLRTHLIRFTDCERVLVSGVTVQNSPKFHIVPQRCRQVSIVGVTVRCPWNAQNGDGIDLMNTSDVLIADCTVDVGDDGICIKAGAGAAGVKDGPCSRILVRGNTVFHAHGGFVIGSEFSGGVHDVAVLDNLFSGTDTGLRFKSARGRGGRTSKLFIDNVIMSDIRDQAIVFETGYVNVSVGETGSMAETEEFQPEFCDISISNVVCRDARIGISVSGGPSAVHDVTLKDCTIFCSECLSDVAEEVVLTMDNVKLLGY